MIDYFFPSSWSITEVCKYVRERFKVEPYPWHYWDGLSYDPPEEGWGPQETIQYVQSFDEDSFMSPWFAYGSIIAI